MQCLAAPVLNRILAFVLVSLCASPFTAPFRTWAPMEAFRCSGTPSVQAVSDDGSLIDPAALTVPTLDARAAVTCTEAPLGAVIPLIELFAELGPAMQSRRTVPHRLSQYPPPRIVALRV
jgi:hypothetical protein